LIAKSIRQPSITSQSVFADGALPAKTKHLIAVAVALETITRDKAEKANDRKVAGVPGVDPKTNVRSAG
jgi:alkylhydroperoxidase/carboxymuconolactone decarboxylase family protein YurZ